MREKAPEPKTPRQVMEEAKQELEKQALVERNLQEDPLAPPEPEEVPARFRVPYEHEIPEENQIPPSEIIKKHKLAA